jgi:hypothetical protein
MQMLFDNKIIKIEFKKNIIKNVNELYFKPNLNIMYYNNNHLNYIYKFKNNDIEYTFNGFFKDGYFAIIFDTYSEKLNINIEHKYVYLIKLNWILKKINNDLILWIIDLSKSNNLNTKCIITTCRKKLFLENININELLEITDYKITNINIDKNIEKKNLIKRLISSIKF